MVIVDTTVWVDYLRGDVTPQTAWLDQALSRERLGITDLILCEVLQGIGNATQYQRTKRQLTKLEVFGCVGAGIAIASAGNYRALRARGITVRKTIDCLIATFCIRNGHELLHDDRDYAPFARFLGLRLAGASPR
jgi:predicted nucleic acid-binding protein